MLLLSATSLAWMYGDIVERRFSIGLIGASLATLACLGFGDWAAAWAGYFVIDFVLLAAVLWLAFTHDHYWPIWFSGFQVVVILADIASIIAPARNANLYGNLGSSWAIPALLVFSIGTVRDAKSRKPIR